MARTIEQIFNSMVAQKEATPELDALTSNSSVAIWRLMLNITATGISIVENLSETVVQNIIGLGNSLIQGSLRWYAVETLLYQFGDNLVYNRDTGRYEYSIIDSDKRVVKQSAANEDSSGKVTVKAAKINDTTGIAEPLSVSELNGLISYWNTKKFGGTNIEVVSIEPDKLQTAYRIIYDGNILRSDGSLVEDNTIFPVEDAINNHLLEIGVINFDGIFQLSSLTDAIQNARGVVNATPTTATARKFDDSTSVDIIADVDQIYQMIAGYMKIDPSYPLSGQLTYIPR